LAFVVEPLSAPLFCALFVCSGVWLAFKTGVYGHCFIFFFSFYGHRFLFLFLVFKVQYQALGEGLGIAVFFNIGSCEYIRAIWIS
jgi:hypothetical protein